VHSHSESLFAGYRCPEVKFLVEYLGIGVTEPRIVVDE
jgi:hypothetical protein